MPDVGLQALGTSLFSTTFTQAKELLETDKSMLRDSKLKQAAGGNQRPSRE
jgi:hypothetical protein